MLRKERRRNFLVYPSWAQFTAKWTDLPRLFTAPLSSGFFERDFDPQRYGYPQEIQAYELIDGPAGGGLIAWDLPRSGRGWLPLGVFARDANVLSPNGMDRLYVPDDDEGYVLYLEPSGPGWQLGLPNMPRNINPALSMEHADAAGDKMYWVVRFRRARKSAKDLKGLSAVPDWARHFGLEAVRLSAGAPEALRLETNPWFTNPEYESAWFEVTGNGDSAGYHFAVLVYIGNHLRWVGGPRMDSMHLVAQIEGRPNVRRLWSRKN